MNLNLYIRTQTYNHKLPQNGISLCSLCLDDGTLSAVKALYPECSFSSPCFHPIFNDIFYCGVVPYEICPHSQLRAYRMSSQSGEFTEFDRIDGYPIGAGQAAVSRDGKYLVCIGETGLSPSEERSGIPDGTAAYLLLYTLNDDGSFGAHVDTAVIRGCGPNDLQHGAMPHCIFASPIYDVFVCCDLGSDKVRMFYIDSDSQKLLSCDEDGFFVGSGREPRIAAFHPTRPWVYLNLEAVPNILGFSYNEKGLLTPLCDVPVIDYEWSTPGPCGQSDFICSANGKNLYSVVRNASSVSVFSIDDTTGKASLIQNVPIEGAYTMGITMSPDGRFAIICAKKGHLVHVYSVAEDGTLSYISTITYTYPEKAFFAR